MNIYLDIDGTLIRTTEKHHHDGKYEVAHDCLAFLQFCTNNFHCYWLTFHARKSYKNNISRVFREAIGVRNLSTEWIEVIEKIRVAPWSHLKTEGINFNEDFFWIDDDVSDFDMAVLEGRNVETRLIKAHANIFFGDLLRIKAILSDAIIGRGFEVWDL